MELAKTHCAANDACKAITCDSSNENCTLRASSDLRDSPKGEITYKCAGKYKFDAVVKMAMRHCVVVLVKKIRYCGELIFFNV